MFITSGASFFTYKYTLNYSLCYDPKWCCTFKKNFYKSRSGTEKMCVCVICSVQMMALYKWWRCLGYRWSTMSCSRKHCKRFWKFQKNNFTFLRRVSFLWVFPEFSVSYPSMQSLFFVSWFIFFIKICVIGASRWQTFLMITEIGNVWIRHY